MLITLLVLVALFFAARLLIARYGGSPVLANATAFAIVIAFAAGFALRGVLLPEQPPAPVTVAAPSPAPTPLPGLAVSPRPPLSASRVENLAESGKPIAWSVIESLAGTGSAADHFRAGTPVTIRGWAGDPATTSTAAGLLAIIDGKERIDITKSYGGDRMDVASAFKTAAMLRTNIVAPISTAHLAKGVHRIELGAIARDGRHFRVISLPAKTFTLE